MDIVNRICGAMPAMLTPFTPDLHIDNEAQRRIVQFFLQNGVHGVVVLGSTGEFQGARWEERAHALATVVDEVDGKVPVIAGAGLPNLWATIDQIKEASDNGADAMLVTPPYYFPIGQDQIIDWFAKLVEASPIPVMYYHFPKMTKLTADPDTIVRLREVGVVGVKDSGGNTGWLHSTLIRTRGYKDFKLLLGSDYHLVDALINGADGCIGLPQNVVPHISVQMYESFQSNNLSEANRLQKIAVDFLDALMISPSGQPYAKGLLEKMGLCDRTVAPPFVDATDGEIENLWANVRELCRPPQPAP